MACRRGRKVEAHRRWPSVSSIDPPVAAETALCREAAPAAGPLLDMAGNGRQGNYEYSSSGGSVGVGGINGGVGICFEGGGDGGGEHSAGDQRRAPHQGVIVDEKVVGIVDEGYPEIPTDDLGVFMATLVEGMRSDGVQLANTAKNVVANTVQVVVRPLEAVARLAAPFLPQQNLDALSSRENAIRGQDLLDNALAFRMPGAFAGRPRNSTTRPMTAGDDVGPVGRGRAGKDNGGALRAINGNSPPRESSPSTTHARGLSSKRGRGAQRGRLGAVKLAVTPPGKEERRRVSCSPSPSSGGRNEAAGDSYSSQQPGRLGRSRRVSWSSSPPRRGLASAFASVLPFGAISDNGTSPPRRGGNRESTGGEWWPSATTPGAHRAIVEGSRIDLRKLDRARGGGLPRAYRCRDGSVVVLGERRMVSARPSNATADFVVAPADGVAGAGEAHGGVVTWVLGYGELESCSINVSAGKESERSVGDVVVEITTRPAKTAAANKQQSRRSFCLANSSECLELLRSIQARWQPLAPPSPSGSLSPTSSGSENADYGWNSARGERQEYSDGTCDGFTRASRLPQSQVSSSSSSSSSIDNNRGGGGTVADGQENAASNGGAVSVFSVTPTKSVSDKAKELSPLPPSSSGGELLLYSPSQEEAQEARPGAQGRDEASSPLGGVKSGVSVLESPAKVLRDQLRERHEEHEKGLKEDLAWKAKSSRASLQRRRQLRRSVSQGASTRGGSFSPAPATHAKSPAAVVSRQEFGDGCSGGGDECAASVDGNSTGPDLLKDKNIAQAGRGAGATCQTMAVNGDASPAVVSFAADALALTTVPPTSSMPPPPARAGTALSTPGDLPSPVPSSTSGGPVTPPPTPPPLPGMCVHPPLAPPLPGINRGGSDRSLSVGSSPAFSPLSSCRSDGGVFFGRAAAGGTGGAQRTPDTPTRRRTSKPLLNLHWDVLPPAKIERTVWARTAARVESVDDAEVQELEKLFSKKSAAVGSGRRSTLGGRGGGAGFSGGINGMDADGTGASGGVGDRGGRAGREAGTGIGGKVKKVQLLEVSRGNNVAIGLKAFKRVGSVSELARLVGGLDPKEVLTTEDLQRLEACLPTGPELETVLAYKGPAEALGLAETFFRALAPTPRPGSKVSTLLFWRQFGSIAEEASARLEMLRMACEEATKSDRLPGVLERVLAIGNVLNEGTYRGNACGFRLASLLKLSHTKSHADKKTTVLNYMVRSVAAKERATVTAAAKEISASVGSAEQVAATATVDSGEQGVAKPSTAPATRDEVLAANKPATNTSASAKTATKDSSGNSNTAAAKRVSSGLSEPRRGGSPPGRRSPPGSGGRISSGARRAVGAAVAATTRGGPGRASGVRSRGGGSKRPVLTRVEMLDLETELKHVRAASKVPVSDILQDVRQARCGLKQAKDELDRVLVEETKMEEKRGGGKGHENGEPRTSLAAETAGLGFVAARERLSAVSERSERSTASSSISAAGDRAESGESDGVAGGSKATVLAAAAVALEKAPVDSAGKKRRGTGGPGAGGPGVRKLASFVDEAEARLLCIDEKANECVVLCKGLGEFFGEGEGEDQSAHIFCTLVQFLDLLAEAKKVEGIC